MAHTIRHLTGTAKPGPPNDRPARACGTPSATLAHVAAAGGDSFSRCSCSSSPT